MLISAIPESIPPSSFSLRNVKVYIGAVDCICVSDTGLTLEPRKESVCGNAGNLNVAGLSVDVLRVIHAALVGVVLGIAKSADYSCRLSEMPARYFLSTAKSIISTTPFASASPLKSAVILTVQEVPVSGYSIRPSVQYAFCTFMVL